MNLIRIDTLFNYEKGSLQSSKNVSGNYNFITASVDWKTHREYTHETEALIFAAAAAGSLGRTHYVNGKFIASDLCFILTPKDPENYPIDLRFYHIIFNELRKDIVKNTKSGTSKEAIGLSSFGKYEIPYFEINKQIDIKGKYVASEEIKNELTSEFIHQLNLLKKLRQQILQDAVQGKLVPQDPNDEHASVLLERIKTEKEKLVREKKIKKEKLLPPINPDEIPFEIPESWVWCRLGEICFKITDGFHNTPPKIGSGIPYISATHVKSDKIDWENCDYVAENFHRELYNKAYPQKGELLVVNIGAGSATPAIIDVTYEFSFKNTAILKFNQGLLCNNYLFYYFLLSRENIYDTLTQGGLQPFLSLKILNNITLPLPPRHEQNQIVAKIKQLMTLCDELEQTIQQHQKYTQELLQVALKDALEPKN